MGIYDKVAGTKRTLGNQSHSRYWLGGSFEDTLDLADRGTDTAEVIRLAAIKQSITNFVRIVTNQQIPVAFSSGQDSYTTGKEVVISASTKEKEFDSVVGLALHEASHVKLTNFEFLQAFHDYGIYMLPRDLKDAASRLSIADFELIALLKLLMNIFEDRHIDYFMYRTAPGYRPYYESMYNHYFNAKVIDEALLSGQRREPTVENFTFYLLNLTNPNFDATHLPGLTEIVQRIDLDHIDRLGASDFSYVVNTAKRSPTGPYDFAKMPEVFKTAVDVAKIIFENATKGNGKGQGQGQGKQGQPQSGQSGQGQGQGDDSKEKNLDAPRGGKGKGQQSDSDDDSDNDSENGEGEGEGDDEGDSDSEGNEASDKSKSPSSKSKNGQSSKTGTDNGADAVSDAKLDKAIKQQKEFVSGDVKKKNLSKAQANKVKAVEQSGAKMTEIDYTGYKGSVVKAKVVVMRKLTAEIMTSGAYPFTYSRHSANADKKLYENEASREAVSNGLRMGAILAQRLSVRNQNQVAKHVRQDEGHLDKRRLAALGYDEENVFFHLRKTEYKPVFIHLSIDASGSMQSNRAWTRALTVGVALAVAAEKIDNLDVVLSVRASNEDMATISIIYDSRLDNVTKIKRLFPALCTTGSTPEGLCFAAILDDILNVQTEERYFINLSDGQPAHGEYCGEAAYRHTREQVSRMANEGVKIMSYYIESNYGGGSDKEAFGRMYGKSATYVNVEQIASIATTMNRLLLTQ